MTGDFGYGWTWNYGTNLNLSADANGGVTWEQPDGAKNYFHKNNGDGSYTAEQGIYSVLYERRPAKEVVRDLMSRPIRSETE